MNFLLLVLVGEDIEGHRRGHLIGVIGGDAFGYSLSVVSKSRQSEGLEFEMERQ